MTIDTNYIRVKDYNNNECCQLNIQKVHAIYYNDDFSVLHTKDGKFLCPITLQGIEEWESEFGFTKSDRYIYVNLNLVKKFHSRLNIILFDDIDSVKKARSLKLPEAYLHHSYMKKFSEFMGKENDLAYKTQEKKSSSIIFVKNFADEI